MAGALADVRYAMRQLREFGDVGRALDALERVEGVLGASDGRKAIEGRSEGVAAGCGDSWSVEDILRNAG